jgi:hypothetical protein
MPTYAMPHDAVSYFMSAVAHYQAGDYSMAITDLEYVTSASPMFGEAHCNLAALYNCMGRRAEAITEAESAVALLPNDADSHNNLAVAYHSVGRYADSLRSARRSVALDQNKAIAHFNVALLLLLSGDFSQGWDEYIWTWRVPSRSAEYRLLEVIQTWSGEDFGGRSLVITLDEGFGDALQFVRYLPLVKSRGGTVTLVIPEPLLNLFNELPGVDHLLLLETGISADLHVPLSGLSRIFFPEFGFRERPLLYIHAQQECIAHWRQRLERPGKLRVGIVWSGDPGHANDRRRSMRIDDFAPLSDIEGVAWFGLQKGIDEDLRGFGSLTIDPLGSEIGDFSDTAAIIMQLDLVITVDTAVAHLAGALGKPVWTLLHFVPDWRWQLERDDSPWYPTMRLFRQPTDGDWAAVIANVALSLHILKQC